MSHGSIGRKLLVVRKSRGLSLEDVAFHTRIPVARLREMENDDLSNFASITYARSFLRLYSRYLDVDISEYLDQFSTSAMAAAAGHEFVQAAHAGGSVFSGSTSARNHRRSGLLVATTIVIGVVAVIAVRNLVAGGHDTAEGTAAPGTKPPAAPSATQTAAASVPPTPPAPKVPLRQTPAPPAPAATAPAPVDVPAPTAPPEPIVPPPVEPSAIALEKSEAEVPTPPAGSPPKAVPVPEDDPQ